MSMDTLTTRLRRDPATVVWAVALGCWLLMIGLLVLGDIDVADHDTVIEHSTLPMVPRLMAFAGAWLVMIGAMMLPTTVPVVRLFVRATAAAPGRFRARTIFVVAYAGVWLLFALVALAGDTQLHALVHRWPWLHDHEPLILAGALLVAGAAQFSPLTTRCLRLCRDPRAYLMARYRRGTRGAWDVGTRHALSCLGCCWALMLIMFATGVGSLAWMIGLTAVMVVQKSTAWGRRVVEPVGVVLLGAGAVIAALELNPLGA